MASPRLLDSLSEPDLLLVRATEPAELGELDEDALLDLHARVRRARNKHVGVYRRQAAARVPAKGARGAARAGNQRNAARAEVFEEALARVSRQLSAAARQSARELKEERLALARGGSAAAPAPVVSAPRTSGVTPRVRKDTTRDSPGRKKREASTKASGARRQARRDSRSG
ncbi:MAG: hypothetical protein JST91_04790 [Actinobacteria bacterium]|nr:hypothetical protein [Actinomycetota bacterium]